MASKFFQRTQCRNVGVKIAVSVVPRSIICVGISLLLHECKGEDRRGKGVLGQGCLGAG